VNTEQSGSWEPPEHVLRAYGLDGAHLELLTGGRTNRTLRARAGRDLVLQQMLGAGHHDLLGVMENLVRVTSHLEWRRAMSDAEMSRDSWYPLLVNTTAGKPFMMTPEGDVWRAFSYRPGVILRSGQPQNVLASAGAMYGRFAAETFDLGGPPLIETAPGFHDLDQVLDELVVAADVASPAGRRELASDLEQITVLKARLDRHTANDGLVFSPDRVVHNDTKLTNVLFESERGRARAVLDLDLAMMGPSWHDVGDLFRSACWTVASPKGEPLTPNFTVELFDAVVGAYVESAGETLTDAEITTFAAAGPRLSLELGARYLHDHLRPEPHLRVDGTNGHLVRGRSNLKLAEEMLGAYDALRRVVDDFITHR